MRHRRPALCTFQLECMNFFVNKYTFVLYKSIKEKKTVKKFVFSDQHTRIIKQNKQCKKRFLCQLRQSYALEFNYPKHQFFSKQPFLIKKKNDKDEGSENCQFEPTLEPNQMPPTIKTNSIAI